MSDDDNYSWLDKHSTHPGAPSNNPHSPPPTSVSPTAGSQPSAAGIVPPPSRRGRSGDRDTLAEQLLATQPKRQKQSRGSTPTGMRLKIGFGVLAVVSLIVYANFIGPDTSSISGLDIGECFEAPDAQRIKRVTMQDCALPHEGQVFAEANGLRDDAEQKCIDAFDDLDAGRIATLPRDASFAVLNATISHRCVVISPSGQITQALTGP